MPWITKNGRRQFVGDWGSLSDGERWAAIHNRNAAREEEARRWAEEQQKKKQQAATEEKEKD